MSAVLYEVDQNVATLRLNQPKSLNAVNPTMIDALLEATSRAADDPKVRAVLVCTAGKHFMAGGDLKWFQDQLALPEETCRESYDALLGKVQKLALDFQQMEKPVIAAAQGAVAGFGLSLMIAADLVFAAEDAYFTLAYSNIALSPDGGATWTLPRFAGLKKAMEIALLGERFDAPRAREMGLVNRLYPADQLDAEAKKLAIRLAAGPAKAIARTKALINASFDATFEEQLLAERQSFVGCATHPDFAEGLTAFFEKRRPAYRRD
ncbi:MAG: enoyl-CoA hydratase/isomerase family protein [Candidatus Accumulibacter sp.]|jgi:2-(1,2-epoxy-1,2-dihydrophenyl)acetyl-CoA isomerase|nr:enoyl-CoA hydratase/isomerase family protein [Accumulibacter sp.]